MLNPLQGLEKWPSLPVALIPRKLHSKDYSHMGYDFGMATGFPYTHYMLTPWFKMQVAEFGDGRSSVNISELERGLEDLTSDSCGTVMGQHIDGLDDGKPLHASPAPEPV